MTNQMADTYMHDLAAWLPCNGAMESSADSSDGSAYVAEITGEHPKYGVDRAFATVKEDAGKRTLPPSEVFRNRVYEIQHCDADPERTYHFVDDVVTDEDGEVVDVETTELDGSSEALDALDWEGDGERAQLRNGLDDALDRMDTDELRALAARVGATDDGTDADRDPADLARVNPADIPGAAGDRIGDMRKAFVAAYDRRFNTKPDAETRAAVIDAAALVEKRRND